MIVKKNMAHAVDGKLIVVHPDTGKPFPGDEFKISDADLANPRVRTLFAPAGTPGGLPGGKFGDLLVVPAATPSKK
jgi:hypothetical protein